MTHPAPPHIDAAVDALHAEANVWNDIHERLNRCAARVRTLRITEYLDVPIFGHLLERYNEVAERFAARCSEGAVETFAVGLALSSVADGFTAAEEANLNRLHGLVESGGHDG